MKNILQYWIFEKKMLQRAINHGFLFTCQATGFPDYKAGYREILSRVSMFWLNLFYAADYITHGHDKNL